MNAERDTSDPAPTAKLVEREIGEMASYVIMPIRSQSMWTLFEKVRMQYNLEPKAPSPARRLAYCYDKSICLPEGWTMREKKRKKSSRVDKVYYSIWHMNMQLERN